jgi:putative sigma-54 modulation protein
MEVTFTARHYDVPAELRDYITRKIEKLGQYHDGIREARVILTSENYRNIAEVTLLARRRDFVGREESADMQSSVDLVIDKLVEQLKRFKEKRVSRGRRSGRAAYAAGAAPSAPPDAPQITFRDTMERPESLTVEQALAVLDDEGGEILVFENTATKKTTVIYRREDGSYGLIEPAG